MLADENNEEEQGERENLLDPTGSLLNVIPLISRIPIIVWGSRGITGLSIGSRSREVRVPSSSRLSIGGSGGEGKRVDVGAWMKLGWCGGGGVVIMFSCTNDPNGNLASPSPGARPGIRRRIMEVGGGGGVSSSDERVRFMGSSGAGT